MGGMHDESLHAQVPVAPPKASAKPEPLPANSPLSSGGSVVLQARFRKPKWWAVSSTVLSCLLFSIYTYIIYNIYRILSIVIFYQLTRTMKDGNVFFNGFLAPAVCVQVLLGPRILHILSKYPDVFSHLLAVGKGPCCFIFLKDAWATFLWVEYMFAYIHKYTLHYMSLSWLHVHDNVWLERLFTSTVRCPSNQAFMSCILQGTAGLGKIELAQHAVTWQRFRLSEFIRWYCRIPMALNKNLLHEQWNFSPYITTLSSSFKIGLVAPQNDAFLWQ